MNARLSKPDQRAPGSRKFQYAFFCWMNRHPKVIRLAGSVLRRWPFLSHILPIVARKKAVENVLSQPRSFSNNAHSKNLIAEKFQIGMDPDQTYDQDKALFDEVLKKLNPQIDADNEARNRVKKLSTLEVSDLKFDLIEDYLACVFYEVILKGFGPAANTVVSQVSGMAPDDMQKRRYIHEIRHVAAHLFAGSLAPLKVQRRAELCAAALRNRVDNAMTEIEKAWLKGNTKAEKSVIRRTAIGYTWVSHPVTVQSAALAFQELMSRPKVYKKLCEQARVLGDEAWVNKEFRFVVMRHVLELMRFRPTFPALPRDIPRYAEFDSGAHTNTQSKAGSSVSILSIAAMFDATETPRMNQFLPHREWGNSEPIRYMMFGYGDRQCPAKNHAVTMITSAFIGLLLLGRLRWADRWGANVQYDGPMIRRMHLKRSETTNNMA